MAQNTSDKDTPVQSINEVQTTIITEYLSKNCSIFAELKKLCDEVSHSLHTWKTDITLALHFFQCWASKQADEYFKLKQRNCDEAPADTQTIFLKMMREIAREMDKETRFLTDINTIKKTNPRAPPPKVLDQCMAPGGFSEEVYHTLCPLTEIYGITLPTSHGGYELLVKQRERLKVEFVDITLLAADMGATETDIPDDHPDKNSFVFRRTFSDKMFDLIISDGQVLRTHKRQEYREKMEALRLSVSQLIFALQHIKTDGTFVMLLHNVNAWRVLKLIYTFTKISSSVQLFKPIRKHKIRSSFYLVAKGVKPHAPEALRVIDEWKKTWMSITIDFSTWNETVLSEEEEVKTVLADFGETIIKMAEPLWEIQLKALQDLVKNGFPIHH